MGAALIVAAVTSCATGGGPPRAVVAAPDDTTWSAPQRVTIRGWDDDAMEPFLTRDGQWLLFNNRNDPPDRTDLHLARHVNDSTFAYAGPLTSLNRPALDAVPTVDAEGHMYFISTRDYFASTGTVHSATFANGVAAGPARVLGVVTGQRGLIHFDVEVSADGATLIVALGRFTGGSAPVAADFVLYERTSHGFRRAAASDSIFANINTPALEYAAALSADGLELCFTRVELPIHQPPALYLTRRTSLTAPFGPPQMIRAATGFVEAATFSPDARALYYHVRAGDRYRIARITR